MLDAIVELVLYFVVEVIFEFFLFLTVEILGLRTRHYFFKAIRKPKTLETLRGCDVKVRDWREYYW
ncbi:MAG: hypothetical protein ACI9Y7_002647 [Dokdonia sp.]